jgi:hypothetical protein
MALSFKQKHPGNNALARFQANQKARGRATAKIFKNRMMSAANTPFIWLLRLQNRLFPRPRAGRRSLDALPGFAYTSAVPERT